jgi:hypothetical protein
MLRCRCCSQTLHRIPHNPLGLALVCQGPRRTRPEVGTGCVRESGPKGPRNKVPHLRSYWLHDMQTQLQRCRNAPLLRYRSPAGDRTMRDVPASVRSIRAQAVTRCLEGVVNAASAAHDMGGHHSPAARVWGLGYASGSCLGERCFTSPGGDPRILAHMWRIADEHLDDEDEGDKLGFGPTGSRRQRMSAQAQLAARIERHMSAASFWRDADVLTTTV